jgi:ankyrin repeat protein
MLKLIISKALIISSIASFVFAFSEAKAAAEEQKKTTGTLSVSAQEKARSAAPDTAVTKFDISIEGYHSTQLGQAVYAGDVNKVQGLINKGASIEQCLTDETYVYDLLYTALAFKKTELVRYVLKNKLYKSVNTIYSEEAETPLALACNLTNSKEALEIAASLIALGANVNGAGESGGENTHYPLFIALSGNNVSLAKLLIEHGANKDIKNERGETPLSIAQKKGFEDILRLLKGN